MILAKQTNGDYSEHILIYGRLEFGDYPFSAIEVILLDDRIVSWALFGGRNDPEKEFGFGQKIYWRRVVEFGLTIDEVSYALSRMLGVERIDVLLEPNEVPPHWTFHNHEDIVRGLGLKKPMKATWTTVDFADFVNQKVTGRPIIPWG